MSNCTKYVPAAAKLTNEGHKHEPSEYTGALVAKLPNMSLLTSLPFFEKPQFQISCQRHLAIFLIPASCMICTVRSFSFCKSNHHLRQTTSDMVTICASPQYVVDCVVSLAKWAHSCFRYDLHSFNFSPVKMLPDSNCIIMSRCCLSMLCFLGLVYQIFVAAIKSTPELSSTALSCRVVAQHCLRVSFPLHRPEICLVMRFQPSG